MKSSRQKKKKRNKTRHRASLFGMNGSTHEDIDLDPIGQQNRWTGKLPWQPSSCCVRSSVIKVSAASKPLQTSRWIPSLALSRSLSSPSLPLVDANNCQQTIRYASCRMHTRNRTDDTFLRYRLPSPSLPNVTIASSTLRGCEISCPNDLSTSSPLEMKSQCREI